VKTTLKDFPIRGDNEGIFSYNYRMRKWKEAFEKELREKLAANWKPYSINDLLKKILGDSKE